MNLQKVKFEVGDEVVYCGPSYNDKVWTSHKWTVNAVNRDTYTLENRDGGLAIVLCANVRAAKTFLYSLWQCGTGVTSTFSSLGFSEEELEEEIIELEEPKAAVPRKCICTHSLWVQGCTCGGI